MHLSKLFHLCAYEIEYQQVGDSVNYAFLEDNSTLYIFFQGSNSISDWVRNFFFKKKPYKDMKIPYRVHRGFLAAWKEVEDLIIEKINQKKSKRHYNSFLDFLYFDMNKTLMFSQINNINDVKTKIAKTIIDKVE